MARAAGDGRNYTIGIVNTEGQLVEELDGFPSVTTIIGATDASKSSALMGWAYNTGLEGVVTLLNDDKIAAGVSLPTLKRRLKVANLTPWSNRDNAAKRGSGIHEWAEKLLLGHATYDDVLDGTPRDQRGYAKALIAWHESYGRTPVAIERTCVHLSLEYAGTTDLIDYGDDPELVDVVDFKTSKRIYDSHFIQGTAYAQAWLDMMGRRGVPQTVDSIGVIRFGEDGKFETKKVPYTGAEVFNQMRALYGALERNKK
jgi:hypothetical protein